MSRETLAKLRVEGAYITEVRNHDIKIANASGETMPISGVFLIKCSFGPGRKLVLAPFVVPMRMDGHIIIGTNVLSRDDVGISLSPHHYKPQSAGVAAVTNDYGNSSCEPPRVPKLHGEGWIQADIVLTKQIRFKPRSHACVTVRLLDQDQQPLPAGVDFIAATPTISYCATTTEGGLSTLLLQNGSDVLRVLEKGTVMGSAEPLEHFDMREKATPASIAAVMEKQAKAAGETVTSGTKLPNAKNPNAKKLDGKLRQRINDAAFKHNSYHHMGKELSKLLVKYYDVLSSSQHDLGRTNTVEHTIDIRDGAEPQFTKQFPVPASQYDLIREHLREWLQLGIVAPTSSKWNAPIFCVPKKEGRGLRVVMDFRKCNRQTLADNYSIRTVEECILDLGRHRSRYFSSLDLSSGFWQMPLRKSDRDYTAFTLPGVGQFHWTVGAMGLMGCPASFSRLMEIVMSGLDNVITYIDDVLVHSNSKVEHIKHLEAALVRLREHNLKLNLDKCTFGAASLQYLGHTLTPRGITPGLAKTAAIRDMSPPTTPKAVKSLCGLLNYFRSYIEKFASRAQPLFALTSSSSKWRGGELPEDAYKAFKDLQQELDTLFAPGRLEVEVGWIRPKISGPRAPCRVW